MSNKGHTGREGRSVKAYGLLGIAVGLVWMLVLYVTTEAGASFVLPAILMIAGIASYLAGRGMANSHAIARD